MSRTVLIVPDKFKGTLTAPAAAAAIARGWRKARPGDQLRLLPMSDGGDGFGEVMSGLLDAKVQAVETVNAAHRPCRAEWWWEPKTRTAIIESARVIGLAQLPPGKFHPFQLDTFGLGAALRAAQSKGARCCLVGVGGSATNDGGFGMARALGWAFIAGDGKQIEQWTGLHLLAEIRPPKSSRRFPGLIVAVDVQNPLLGSRGCSRIYGPQKGLRSGDFPLAESCLRQLTGVVKRKLRRDVARTPGAGAAGGLGFGLKAFLGARLDPGFALFARLAQLPHRLRSADLVITGEGAIDQSTHMGKGVGEIARCCRKLKVPCIGLAGAVARPAKTQRLFAEVHALTELTTPEEAKAKAALWLERLAVNVAGRCRAGTVRRVGGAAVSTRPGQAKA